MEALRHSKGQWRVSRLDSLSHASTVTDALSQRPTWSISKPSLWLQWGDYSKLCVCSSEDLCNHQNPSNQSQTNGPLSRLVPGARMWAKWSNKMIQKLLGSETKHLQGIVLSKGWITKWLIWSYGWCCIAVNMVKITARTVISLNKIQIKVLYTIAA